MITFEEVRARYVKLEVLSTVGIEYGRAAYLDATLHLGGLLLFKNA